MTIPYERTLAVLRTRELLAALASREKIDTDLLQRRAASLLKHFPGAMDIDLSAAALPTVWARVNAKWYEG